MIVAWLGHADGAFTTRTYIHSQDGALRAAAGALGSETHLWHFDLAVPSRDKTKTLWAGNMSSRRRDSNPQPPDYKKSPRPILA